MTEDEIQDATSSKNVGWRRWLMPALLPILLVIAVLTLGTTCVVRGTSFNSDELYLVELCDIILGGQESLVGWHFSAVTYLFPDICVLLVCRCFFDDLAHLFLSYALVNFTLVALALTLIARQVGLAWRDAWVAAATGVFLSIATHLGTIDSHEAYSYRGALAYVPGFHFGSITAGLYLVWLTILRVRCAPTSRLIDWAFVFLGALASFSDELVVVVFLLPIGVSLALLALAQAVPARLAARTAFLAGLALAGSRLFRCLLAWGGCEAASVDSIWRSHSIWKIVWEAPVAMYATLRGQYVVQGIVAGFAVLSMLYLAQNAFRRRTEWEASGAGPAANASRDDDRSRVAALSLWLIIQVGCASNIAAVAVTGVAISQHMGAFRYWLAVVFLPFLLIAILVRVVPWTRRHSALLGTIAVVYGMFRIAGQLDTLKPENLRQPYPEMARLLDRLSVEQGLDWGIGGYWQARHLSYLTKRRVRVRPATRAGEPWLHTSSAELYLDWNGDGPFIPTYRFIVVDFADPMLDPARIRLQHGEPTQRFPCGACEIWVYDRLSCPPFASFLNSTLAQALVARFPHWGPTGSAALARPRLNLTSLETRGLVKIRGDSSLELEFAETAQANALDIGCDYANGFRLRFDRGTNLIGTLFVPRVPWTGCAYSEPGIQSRLVVLPEEVRSAHWDKVSIEVQGPATAQPLVGHCVLLECPSTSCVSPAGGAVDSSRADRPVQHLAFFDSNSGTWQLLLADRDHFEQLALFQWSSSVPWKDLRSGDFDGDGATEVVGRDPASGIWWQNRCSELNAAPTVLGQWRPKVAWRDVQCADFNGDGRDDLVARDPDSGTWWLAAHDGSMLKSEPTAVWPAGSWANVMTGDFDNDGRADLVGRGEDGRWFVSKFLDETTETKPWGATPMPVEGRSVVCDVDGDGLDDLALVTNSGSQLVIGRSTGGRFDFNRIEVPAISSRITEIASGDFNGDGRRDLALLTPSAVELLLAVEQIGPLAFRRETLSVSGLRLLAVADFDGDGRQDLAALAADSVVQMVRISAAGPLVSCWLSKPRMPISGEPHIVRIACPSNATEIARPGTSARSWNKR